MRDPGIVGISVCRGPKLPSQNRREQLPAQVLNVGSQSRSLPSTSPAGWSTVSNGSSVQDEDELSVPVDLLAMTSALSIHERFPETSGSFAERHQDFGQAFAGSSATDVIAGLGPSSRDTGHATRPQAAPSAKNLGEICETGETIPAAAPQVRYFQCPFSKHSPVRYERVMNVCTNRPGWVELKRVL